MKHSQWWWLVPWVLVCAAMALAQQRGAQGRLWQQRLFLGYDTVERDSSRGVLDTARVVLNWAGILSDSATVVARGDTSAQSRRFLRKIRGRYVEALQATGGAITLNGETYDTLSTWKAFTFERWAGTHTISDTTFGIDTTNWDVLARNRTGLTLIEFMTTPNDTGNFRAAGDSLRRELLDVTVYGDRQPREY